MATIIIIVAPDEAKRGAELNRHDVAVASCGTCSPPPIASAPASRPPPPSRPPSCRPNIGQNFGPPGAPRSSESSSVAAIASAGCAASSRPRAWDGPWVHHAASFLDELNRARRRRRRLNRFEAPADTVRMEPPARGPGSAAALAPEP